MQESILNNLFEHRIYLNRNYHILHLICVSYRNLITRNTYEKKSSYFAFNWDCYAFFCELF